MRESLSAWLEIDLDAVAFNCDQVRGLFKPDCSLIAVVKNNAYGLGAPQMARTLEDKVAMFAVTTVEEAVELRLSGINKDILVFIPPAEEQAALFYRYGLTASLDGLATLEALAAFGGGPLNCHLKVNTGMNRLGAEPEDVPALAAAAGDAGFSLKGIYSHFARAAEDDLSPSLRQLDQFKQVLAELDRRDIAYGLAHIANSAATLRLPQSHLSAVRVGTLLYGQSPVALPQGLQLRDPFKACARLVAVRHLAAGEALGYGGEFVAKSAVKVGIVAIGYGDGFTVEPHSRQGLLPLWRRAFKDTARIISKKPRFYFSANGQKLPLLGRVGMQLCACDLGGGDFAVGDVLNFPVRRTCASARLARVYLAAGREVAVSSVGQ